MGLADFFSDVYSTLAGQPVEAEAPAAEENDSQDQGTYNRGSGRAERNSECSRPREHPHSGFTGPSEPPGG